MRKNPWLAFIACFFIWELISARIWKIIANKILPIKMPINNLSKPQIWLGDKDINFEK